MHAVGVRCRRTHDRKSGGFSLMELLIVVVIVAGVAVVAIPMLIRSRLEANEEACVRRCRDIAAAESAYAAANQGRYAELPALVAAGLIDPQFARKGALDGYDYAMGDVAGTSLDGLPPKSYGFVAVPRPGNGRHAYAVGPDKIVRFQRAALGFSLPTGFSPGDPVP